MNLGLTAEMLGKREISFIGLGVEGSVIFPNLFRMLVAAKWEGTIKLYDPQRYEDRNRFNQQIFKEDVKQFKVDAIVRVAHAIVSGVAAKGTSRLVRSIAAETGITLVPMASKVLKEAELSGIVISAVDSMWDRKNIWPLIKKKPNEEESQVSFYIDTRLGPSGGRVYGIDPSNEGHIVRYQDVKKHYYNDPPPVLDQGCKSEFPRPSVAMTAASFAIETLIAWCNLEQGSDNPVPNFWEFDYLQQYRNYAGAPYVNVEFWDHDAPEF